MIGNDFLHGGDDNDVLIGGAGDDRLRGDKGDDTLIMDAGNDILSGEEGADTFVFNTTEGPGIIILPVPIDGPEIIAPFPDGEFEFIPAGEGWTATVTDFTIFEDTLVIDGMSLIEAAFAGLINPGLSGFDENGATSALNTGDTIIFEGITEAQFLDYLDTVELPIIPIDPEGPIIPIELG